MADKTGQQTIENFDVAELMGKKQRDISIAEFFEKNRHLLGFDNKKKALLTTIKEAVDNSLDACEEARIIPEIAVEVIDMNNDRFRVIVQDNGPGIVRDQIPKIFAKLLYGSKFHRLSQSRGQQGIGISAAALYGQLTTGRPIKIISRTSEKKDAIYCELHIDTTKNKPEIIKEETIEWSEPRGTRIELDLEASYSGGATSVDAYLRQTAIVNPHVTIIYTNPKAEQTIYARATKEMPIEAKEIKPHPYGVELGMLIKMLKGTESKTIQSFFATEFSRVGAGTSKDICNKAGVLPSAKPGTLNRDQAERLIIAIRETKIIAPPTDCLSPIGSELLEKGLRKELKAEFFCTKTRPPSVYRGNPFIVEAGIAYGGELPGDSSAKVLRFANRVPLQYQQGGCAITQSIVKTNWRSYGLSQSSGSIPIGPMVILVHIASVWAPFTSEAKEAIAHYPEIIKEIKLALQDCGRLLARYVARKRKVKDELKKRSYIEKYIPHVAEALKDLLDLKQVDQDKIGELLKEMLEKKRGKLEVGSADYSDYEEDLAVTMKGEEE